MRRQMRAMRARVEESVMSSVTKASSEDEMVALKNEYNVNKDKLMMEISRLTQALATEQELRQTAEKETSRMATTLQEKKDVSDAAKKYIASLEEEKVRLEGELAESMRTLPSTPAFGSSRQRAPITNAGSDRLADLEAGLDLDNEKEDRKADVGLSSSLAKALNFVWALSSKYPAVTRVIGERPPRLSFAGQGILVYMLVLHMLIFLRIV